MAETAHNPQSPFRDLCYAALVRCWSRPVITIAFRFLLILTCLQVLTGFAVVSLLTSAAAANRESWLAQVVYDQYWDLSWVFAAFRMAGLGQRWVIPSSTIGDPVQLVLDLLQTSVTVFLPVLAAYSVAPERERGRLHLWHAEGLNPLQVLAAQGLGALAVVFAVSFGLQFAWMGLRATGQPPEPLLGLVWSCGWGTGTILIRAGLLVCVSALCASARKALLWCCGITFLGFPLLMALISVPRRWVGSPAVWEMVNTFGPLIIEGMLFTALLSRAVAHAERSAPVWTYRFVALGLMLAVTGVLKHQLTSARHLASNAQDKWARLLPRQAEFPDASLYRTTVLGVDSATCTTLRPDGFKNDVRVTLYNSSAAARGAVESWVSTISSGAATPRFPSGRSVGDEAWSLSSAKPYRFHLVLIARRQHCVVRMTLYFKRDDDAGISRSKRPIPPDQIARGEAIVSSTLMRASSDRR